MANKATEKKEMKMQEVFTLWKRDSKNGHPYFTGKDHAGERIVGFFNTNKKNPKEPDLKIYHYDGDDLRKEPTLSMWCNVSKNGKQYLNGKTGDARYVGFITNDKDNVKRPYVRVYEQEPERKENTTEPAKNENKAVSVPF